MKVLFISDTLAQGGRQRQLVELLKGLEGRSEVDAELALLSNEVFYNDVHRLDLPIHHVPRRIKKDPSVFWRLDKLLRSIRPDVVQSCEPMCSVYALPAIKRSGAVFVNNIVRDARVYKGAPRGRWNCILLTVPFSNAVVANSEAGLRAYNIPGSKGVCIHNGYDLSRVSTLPPVDEIRKRLNIETPHVVGMVGALEPRKDFPGYLRLAAAILATREDVTFIAVGGGSMEKELRDAVAPRDRERILLLGEQRGVEEIVQCFTVGMLLCSFENKHAEGISNAIMEYMACSKPVIASNSGGTPEIVVHEETGYLVERDDDAALQRYLVQLLDDAEGARRVGEAGRRRLEEHFGLETMVNGYVELFQRMAAQRGKRG